MTDFFKFPHTPHLAWLSPQPVREDKVLSPGEASAFLQHEILVEEKVDGANVGLSIGSEGQVLAQNRGTLLGPRAHPQFEPLWAWLDSRKASLREALGKKLILFGEWCYATHSIRYTKLPDWFLAFDIYDKSAKRFWSTSRRNDLARGLELAMVPERTRGRFTLAKLKALLEEPSALTDGLPEGLYLRWEATEWLSARAKLVRPEFSQAMTEHWSSRRLKRNSLVVPESPEQLIRR